MNQLAQPITRPPRLALRLAAILVPALAIATLLVLAACGSSTPTATPALTATAAPTATTAPTTVFRVTSTPTYTVTPTATVAPASTAVAAGQELYQADCASCHKANGAGGLKLGEATAANVGFAALNDMYKGDWSMAKRAILDGKDEDGNPLDAAMPRWRGKLSDQEVADIVAFLQTLP